LPNHGFRK